MRIELKEISFSYQDGKRERKIFENYSLVIEEGAFVVILGPSGCGKTTLLNIIGGLLKPDKGSVFLGENNYYNQGKRWQDKFRKNHIGYIFQNFYLIDDLSPVDNVMLTMNYGMKTQGKKERIQKIFDSVGISDLMKSKIKNMSGGEQQRLAIARALAQDCDILICDEPTGNLDEENSFQIMEIMKGLQKEGKTIVLVTHNKDLCAYANKVINLSSDVRHGGKNETDGTNCVE